jgi:hypothetical protein
MWLFNYKRFVGPMFHRNLPQTKRVYENDFTNPSNTVFYAVGPPGHDPGTP